MIFLVGPDRTIYQLDKLSDAAKVQLAPYVRDLYAEIRAVKRIRRDLQNAVFVGNELRADMVSRLFRSTGQVLTKSTTGCGDCKSCNSTSRSTRPTSVRNTQSNKHR